MKTLIIIPTYNEALNILKLIENIVSVCKNEQYSILIVDDNSKDFTADLIEKKQKELNNLILLKRDNKYGLASAYIDGFKYGINNGYDNFIQMDADFSHNPSYLLQIIKELKSHDVVIGSRNINGGCVVGWSFVRNFISKGGSIYSRFVLNCPVKDLTGGFNGWSKEILNKINLDKIISNGFCFQIEMKYRAFLNRARILEIPIIFQDRKYGKSKMSKKIFIEALLNVIKLRFFAKK